MKAKVSFVFALFELVSFPPVPAVKDFSRFSCCFQNFQTIKENLFLLRPIECFAHGVTKRVFKVIGPWRFDRFTHAAGN